MPAVKCSVYIYVFLFVFNHCFAQTETTLSGTIYGVDRGSEIYLSQSTKGDLLDSFSVKSDSFQFNLNIDQGDAYFFRFTIDSEVFAQVVYMRAGANVNIKIDKKFQRIILSGSESANEQNNFVGGLLSITKTESSLDSALLLAKDPSVVNTIKGRQEESKQRETQYCETWVRTHPNSPFSIAVIYLYMENSNVSTLESLYNALSEQAKEKNLLTRLIPAYFAQRRENEQFKIGEPVKDFTLNDTAGKASTFSEIKGNSFVLLDIWASWCTPCRKSTPKLKSLLDKYKSRNLKVISISADENVGLWKRAIAEDKMNWIQLSDLQGTNAGFMKENSIFAYPTYIIISPNGIIVSKPYNVDRVGEELEKIYSQQTK